MNRSVPTQLRPLHNLLRGAVERRARDGTADRGNQRWVRL